MCFDDGLSMVYSFYDPDLTDDSLGTYVILDHIAIAREAGLPYVYLGYWVPGSRKMGYKAGLRRAGDLQGRPAGRRSATRPTTGPNCIPLSVDPIAEQVARITLPEIRPVGAGSGAGIATGGGSGTVRGPRDPQRTG